MIFLLYVFYFPMHIIRHVTADIFNTITRNVVLLLLYKKLL